MPDPVAIVGMSVLLPGAPDLDTYWRNLVGGVDAITEVPPGKWDGAHYAPDAERRADRIYCRRGGFVDELAEVDVTGFGIMPNSVPATEPDQLIALRVAAQALADAGGPDRLPADRSRVGVILGRGGYLTPGLVRLDQRVRTASQLVRTLGELLPELDPARLDAVRQAFTDQLGPEAPESAIGLVPNLAASRVANRLDLRGPAYTVDAACASSLIAVDHAVRELASGRCDVVLAGGVHHCHDITFWSVFTQLGALSPSERIRPFHRDADGVLIGEGTGVVVLKRLVDAQRDGDRVYAVVTGTGVASDGRTASLANPDSGGQVRAVRQAWAAAGLDPAEPDSLGLLEAHGTATPAGDTAELATLAEVFGDAGSAVIGSVKSMIGHTMPAAGVAGLVKAALAVHHGVLLPTLHCDDPNPALEKTRFSTLDTARPWDAAFRRAGVNAFGFGGINAHVVLEQAPDRATAPVVVRETERVLRLAAPTVEALRDVLSGPDRALLTAPEGAGPVRLGIVDPTEKRLALARKAVGRGRPWRGRNDVWFADRPLLGPGGGKVAFVFPGLEAELALNCGDVARHFGLPWQHSDAAVGDVGRQGAAVFELGRLLEAALRRMGVVPDALAGHSLGEWTAMAAAGMYAPAEIDAFLAGFDPDTLVVPGLAFAVIGAPAAQVTAELGGREDVVLSHDNAPNQAMICGPAAAVDALVTRFRDAGFVSQVLPFRSGFHTPMLRPYLGPIREAAEGFTLHPPKLPLWSATTVSEYPAAEADVRELFVRHLLEPVRFRPLAEALHAAGFRAFVQVGAGQVGSLIGDTLHGRDHLVVAAHSPHRPGLAQLLRVATALWAEGASLDGTALPGQARATTRKAVKLDLGGHVITLDDRTRAQVGARLTEGSTVDVLAGKGPLAAEFAALLQDTANLASTVLGGRQTPPRPVELNTTLDVSIASMPYLLDHCFFKQPPQADPEDRWPVVPATTVIDHLMGFAEQAAPGRRAVAVHDVRLNQWITAIPAVTVPVRVVPQSGDRVLAALGSYSQAVVELAPAYPAGAAAPWRFAAEDVPATKATELYDDRWMFHGPRFQGVTELTAVGERHVRAVLTAPAAPGALLDNVGQVLGYWIMSRLPERTTVFPVAMREIRFHGPHPAPGERLECLVKITSLTEEFLDADMQLVHNGAVWAEFTGWRDRRFDSNPEIRQADRTPERSTLSKEQPGGWALVHEQWPDLATRELIMRNYLAGPERDAYDRRPPRGRRQWLLGRIAAKDAVRQFLWARGEPEMFPAELRIGNDDAGRPHTTGAYGRELPPVTISIAHRAEAGVAIARFGPCGIDVEEVVPRTESTADAAFGTAERALFAAQDGDPDLWFARFWTAKEAVAKLRGTGLRGEPRDFEVVAAAPGELTVRVAGHDHHVHSTETANPPGAPPRRYVVAWTEETKETAE
jgi:acyl transferase domain-containing protein/phosphopantetheinyl transferase